MNRARVSIVAGSFGLMAWGASGQVRVFEQPVDPAGGLHQSAWYAPDGLDSDIYCWESFTLAVTTPVTKVRWYGGYTNFMSGAGKAPVYDFTLEIWESASFGGAPNVTLPPIVQYEPIGSNGGETATGQMIQTSWPNPVGWSPVYVYEYTLPVPFIAQGGVKYWLQLEAWQGLTPQYNWPPDWGWAGATGGNGSHFRKLNDGTQYQSISHDLAFELYADGLKCEPDVTTFAIPGSAGYGVPNGVLNNDDFFYYLSQFASGNLAVADLTAGAIPGAPGYGVPNGVINNDDFFYYLSLFAAGC